MLDLRADPAASTASFLVPSEPLRLVLALSLDCHEVAACLGDPRGTALWPSSLYSLTAESAARSEWVWTRCRRALDRRLSAELAACRDVPVRTVTKLLRDPASGLDHRERAAAIWALLRRRDPSLTTLVERLAAETELAVLAIDRECTGMRRAAS